MKERSDAQACVRLSTKLSIFARDISFRLGAIFQCPKGTTQISHGIKTKCQTNQLRSSSLLLRTLSHGAHEPISIALRTRFLDEPADDSGHSFAKIAIPCTILPLARFTCFLINQRCSADVLLGFTLLQYTIATHLLPFLSIKNSKILIHWTNIRKN